MIEQNLEQLSLSELLLLFIQSQRLRLICPVCGSAFYLRPDNELMCQSCLDKQHNVSHVE